MIGARLVTLHFAAGSLAELPRSGQEKPPAWPQRGQYQGSMSTMNPVDFPEPVFPQPPPLPRGREIELRGRGTTFVREVPAPKGRKKRPTVLLVHGWTVTADLNFYECFGPLGARYPVVAHDQRGHGRGIRSGEFRLEDCADDIASLIDAMELQRPIVVGYSMGGGVAQLVAQRHPDKIRGIVLCATAHRFASGLHEQAWRRVLLDSVTAVMARLPVDIRARLNQEFQARRDVGNSHEAWVLDEIARHDPAMVLQGLQALAAFDSLTWLGDLDVPVAVVRTLDDTTVPTADQNTMIDALLDRSVFDVDGSHRSAVEKPQEFVAALLGAIADVEDRALTSAQVALRRRRLRSRSMENVGH
jgi:3-oxoadipate enol-lactonase